MLPEGRGKGKEVVMGGGKLIEGSEGEMARDN